MNIEIKVVFGDQKGIDRDDKIEVQAKGNTFTRMTRNE